jgi:hypothetical protein
MAGSLTQSNVYDPTVPRAIVNRIALAWTSDASGNVSGNPTTTIFGTILKVEFVPGTGGSAPTALYDVTLLNLSGLDVLAGQGADLSATVANAVCPGVPFKDGTTTGTVPCVVAEILSLVVANAGNLKSGTVVLYVR